MLDTLLAVVVHAWNCGHRLLHLLEADGTLQAVQYSSFATVGWGALWVLKDGNLWLLMVTSGHRLIRCNQRDLEFKVLIRLNARKYFSSIFSAFLDNPLFVVCLKVHIIPLHVSSYLHGFAEVLIAKISFSKSSTDFLTSSFTSTGLLGTVDCWKMVGTV